MTELAAAYLGWAIAAMFVIVVLGILLWREEGYKDAAYKKLSEAHKELLAARKELAELQKIHASVLVGRDRLLDKQVEATLKAREFLEVLTGPECECCDCDPRTIEVTIHG